MEEVSDINRLDQIAGEVIDEITKKAEQSGEQDVRVILSQFSDRMYERVTGGKIQIVRFDANDFVGCEYET